MKKEPGVRSDTKQNFDSETEELRDVDRRKKIEEYVVAVYE
jgi:hypothetical protein